MADIKWPIGWPDKLDKLKIQIAGQVVEAARKEEEALRGKEICFVWSFRDSLRSLTLRKVFGGQP